MMLPSGNDAATALAEWGGKHLFKNQHHHLGTLNLASEEKSEVDPTEGTSTKLRIKAFIHEMNFYAK